MLNELNRSKRIEWTRTIQRLRFHQTKKTILSYKKEILMTDVYHIFTGYVNWCERILIGIARFELTSIGLDRLNLLKIEKR